MHEGELIQPFGCERRTKSEDSGFNLMKSRISVSKNGDGTPTVKNASAKMSQGKSDSLRDVEGLPGPAGINDGIPHGLAFLWEAIIFSETSVATQSASGIRISKT